MVIGEAMSKQDCDHCQDDDCEQYGGCVEPKPETASGDTIACAWCGKKFPLPPEAGAPNKVFATPELREHIKTCKAHPLPKALRRIAELKAQVENGYDLSLYTASIHWDGAGNTKDWLDGLREHIETVQSGATRYISRRPGTMEQEPNHE